MTLLHPKISEIYAIGTIIEANAPPSGKWLPCQGQILAQANYPALSISLRKIRHQCSDKLSHVGE